MNFQPRSKPLPPSVRLAIVRNAQGVSRPATITMTTSFLMRLEAKLRSIIVRFFAGRATAEKRQKKIVRALLKQSATSARRMASRNHRNFGVGGASMEPW